MTATRAEVVRVDDSTPVATVLEVIEARTRRLMAELAGVPDQWPTRQAHATLRVLVDDSLDEWLDLSR